MLIFKVIKGVFGVGALTAGVWTMAETYADSGGADAVLNGRITAVRAPTDGYFVPISAPLGGLIQTGTRIAALRAVPDSAETASQWAIQTKSEIESLTSQIATLQSMSSELRGQADAYRVARLKKLQADLGAERENVAAMETRARQAGVVLSRDRRYYGKGAAGSVQSDWLGENAATLEWQAARQRLEATTAAVAAAGNNAFVDDGFNSASYSQQRADQIDLQLVGLKADLMHRQGQIAALSEALNPEDGSKRLPAAALAAPVWGVLWKVSSAKGQFVRAGEEVAEMIDCSHFLTVVSVADQAYGGVSAGQRVTFIPEGHGKPLAGSVVWAGAADGTLGATLNLAVQPAVAANARYAFVAALDRAPDEGDSCPIGKRGRLFFDGMNDTASTIADAFRRVSAKVGFYFGGAGDKVANN
jgi:multidrug resistance efflux pump